MLVKKMYSLNPLKLLQLRVREKRRIQIGRESYNFSAFFCHLVSQKSDDKAHRQGDGMCQGLFVYGSNYRCLIAQLAAWVRLETWILR